MSEFINETDEFNIRKVMDSDYHAIGMIAVAEYLFRKNVRDRSRVGKKSLLGYYRDSG